ncbi:flagellar hook-length control protein FliK [Paenibacillus sp. Marseille-P2973]|uniref:flagellar hook-length control protein FliK n=1 Tax=Paenibacillus sp. Marseille-P2973 TaxID=1871032 RepID=UPI001B38C7F2|nr:flagellar hook-length control protein FliK [Paenibacillus sp. Marseille-P2973]MBQ4898921.1 flagellar hook-length control protein FliK [Paenibacillus sp. Marseille-P2973]
MNIGPLLRSVLGDAKPGTPKTLELKPGQVVRGTVLSVSEDGQEAVIQVQGVKLHAALETPLQEGQTTLLQVQPQNEDGLMKLKPVQLPASGTLSAASLASALEALGMDDTPGNREMLQLMQNNGIPLTKENVKQLLSLNAQKPALLPTSEWFHAIGIAMNRGLPLTGETVKGLHQAVFGPPLHSLVSALEEQLGSWLQIQEGPENSGLTAGKAQNGENAAGQSGTGISGGAAVALGGAERSAMLNKAGAGAPLSSLSDIQEGVPSPGAGANATATSQAGAGQAAIQQTGSMSDQLLIKLQKVLAELKGAVLLEGTANGEPAPAGAGTAGQLAASGREALAKGAAAAAEPAAAALPGEGPAGPSLQARPALTAEPWVGRVLKLLGAEHEQQVLRAGASGEPAQPAPAAGMAQQAAASGGGAPQAAQHAQAPGTAAPVPAAGGALPGGVAAEAAPVTQAPPRGEAAGAAAPGGHGGQPAGPAVAGGKAAAQAALSSAALADAPAPETGAAASNSARDTLKSLLLQVAAADDLPAPLQEAARQIVQQLTGQQLLLTTDRTTPFAQVTMFLPFIGPDGEQTASVHIESRRGRKGELDASNCRLWFDLQMKALGQIMVDVQVADKKVLLKIFSEQEATGVFLESRQPEIESALESAGYRLLSLKAEPLIPAEAGESMGQELGQSQSYAPSPYKGVDYRV